MKKSIVPDGWKPSNLLSPGVKVDDTLYVMGALSMDYTTGDLLHEGDITGQTTQVLSSIQAIVEKAGGKMSDVVQTQIFLTDLSNYNAMNDVYRKFFPSDYPARACVKVGLVKPEFLVEMTAVAKIPA